MVYEIKEEELNLIKFKKPDLEWECWLFGTKDGSGMIYIPSKGSVPNWFVRWMMKICLGCRWVKKK